MKQVLFLPLTKVVEQPDGSVEIWGRAADETPDGAREIFDYAASKPLIQAWSEDIYQASGGQSRGNVRAMHAMVAAGKLTELNFLDEDRAVEVVAQVVDPGEAAKVREGVYTGFSWGGRYAKKWQDGDFVRYAAQPHELSLVDNPAIKTARFTLVKADGSVEERDFHKAAEKKEGDYGGREEAGYADPGYQADKKPRYPLKIGGEYSAKRIRAAWNYINKEKNAAQYAASDLEKVRSKIIAAWKEAIDPEGPPSLNKGLSQIGWFAEQLASLQSLQQDVDWEAANGMDNSPVPGQLRDWLAQGVEILEALVAEELDELLADLAKGEEIMSQEALVKLEEMEGRLAKLEEGNTALTEKLAEVEGELAAKEEELAKVKGDNEELAKRVKELEDQPAPAKGALKSLGKAQDIEPPAEAEDNVDPKDTVGLIKRAHQNPVSIPGITR